MKKDREIIIISASSIKETCFEKMEKLNNICDLNSVIRISENKHQLEYCSYSNKVSWCPICKKHYYNEMNDVHTTKKNDNHYHILNCV